MFTLIIGYQIKIFKIDSFYIYIFLLWLYFQICETSYNQSEQWAGGLLVCLSRGEDTLAVWSDRYEINPFFLFKIVWTNNNDKKKMTDSMISCADLELFLVIAKQESWNREQRYHALVHSGILSHTMPGGFSCNVDSVV